MQTVINRRAQTWGQAYFPKVTYHVEIYKTVEQPQTTEIISTGKDGCSRNAVRGKSFSVGPLWKLTFCGRPDTNNEMVRSSYHGDEYLRHTNTLNAIARSLFYKS